MVSVRIFLYSKWGFYLQINAEQQSISGVRTNDEHCVLEMKTTDFGKVTIQGVNANAYIAVNAQGNLYTTANEDESCIWREIHHADGYNYYQSDVYNQFYLGIKRKGAPKNGGRTGLGQVGCAFLTKPAA
ncbi:fibroblast growth factor 2-like [Montipora capricornis]|uniref:fibroblast growth factor 2-like n=1 Tax=Montipora foliosa TaxID=591990 RepID=UPI0035F1C7E0